VDLLVSAFQSVIHQHPDAQLVIIGEGPGKEAAVAEADRLGIVDRVSFLGRLPHEQVAAVLGVAKILVAPYPFEYNDIVGTPLKIMEYMACGKGIVASTAPLHEMIDHEVTGIRVAPANSQTLAEGINRLLEDGDLCNRLGNNARVRAQKFSWDQVSIKVAEILMKEVDCKAKSVDGKISKANLPYSCISIKLAAYNGSLF
jgi:glycosyltransferase involved in cell wall biosynthesis